MTQYLHPLYGEYITDASVARSIPGIQGVYEGMDPSLISTEGTAWRAILGPGKWKTAGDQENGRYLIEETDQTEIPIEAADGTHSRIDLLVGIHGWAQGPELYGTLTPSGEFTPAQMATYAIVIGVPAESPEEPYIPDPFQVDGDQVLRAVVLARIYVPAYGQGDPVIERRNDLRFESFAESRDEVIAARAGTYSNIGERMAAIEANKHDRNGDETHTGGCFRVEQAPIHPLDVVRLQDMSSLIPGVDLKNRIAIGSGAIAHGGIIPLPTYKDGTVASASEIWATPYVAPRSIQFGHGDHDTTLVMEAYVDMPSRQVVARTRLISGGGSYRRAYDGWANYLIICIREQTAPPVYGPAAGSMESPQGAASGNRDLPVFSGTMTGSLAHPGGSATGTFT